MGKVSGGKLDKVLRALGCMDRLVNGMQGTLP